MQFQYTNLARYAQRAGKHCKTAERHQQAMETAFSKERKQRRQVQQEVLDLKSRLEDLEEKEVKLQKWEARKDVINHYLKVVNVMAA
jgi:flagellar motility protein MotE (MotC chaperone)